LIKDYIALTKPRITWLILMSTGVGYFFGAQNGWHLVTLIHTIIGTGLIASGTAALNQWYEREADAKMRRTQARPLPAGRLDAWKALVFAILISMAGFAELWIGANALSALLGLFTLLSYLFVYTPLKQRSPHSTTIGSIPGAMPPLIGFAAASGTLTWQAWVLFAILFLWQFPHFYAIAWMYKEDGAPHFAVLDRADSHKPDAEVLCDGRQCVPVWGARAGPRVPLRWAAHSHGPLASAGAAGFARVGGLPASAVQPDVV